MNDNSDELLTRKQWKIVEALMTAASVDMPGSITTVWSQYFMELYEAAHDALNDNPKADLLELTNLILERADATQMGRVNPRKS